MHRQPTEATRIEVRPESDGRLSEGQLQPGDLVHADQYVCKLKGRLQTSRGKEKDAEMYTGGTIYVDSASGFVYVQNQVSLGVIETLRGKHLFEREIGTCGVTIRAFRTDNGVFKSKEFQDNLNIRGQFIDFSGVGAHHQNGIAERAIRTITESARTMLLHAAIHWPEEVTLSLWPFVMDYAAYLWNRMPREDSGIAPLELLCGTKLDPKIL
jgi:hypothetical protein